jgi:YD repeat-containing protein
MTESNEVAPLKAEEQESPNLVSFGDIAEASGMASLFESASEDKTEESAEYSEESNDESEEEVGEELEEEQGEEGEVGEEPEEPEPQGDSDGVKKRIGKLIEARNKAEEETAELRSRIEELEKAEPQRQKVEEKGMDRFEDLTTIQEVKQREDDAEHLRDWLMENPDGGEYTDLSGDEHEVEYDQARKLMAQTDRDLRKNIPKVIQKIQQREGNFELAKKTFEWMKDESSPEMVESKKVLQMNEALAEYYKKDPYAVLTLGYAMEGIKAINARQAKKPVNKTAPSVPSAPSRAKPSVVKGRGKNKKSLLANAGSGDIEDASSYIESIL